MQLTHYSTKFTEKTFPIILLCDNVSNAANLGGLLRIADAFGVEKVVFCGDQIELTKKSLRASRATENVVNHEFTSDSVSKIKRLKTNGYQVVALEITSSSKPIHQLQLTTSQPFVLVIGNENFGVSDAVLNLSDHVIHIEMFGQNSSMNVVQAASIALYEITKQLL